MDLKKWRKPLLALVFIELTLVSFMIMNVYFNSAGVYSKELNIAILFTKNYDETWALHTATHEIGHYIYFKHLTQDQRNNYEILFKDSNEFVSEYSKINAIENFAEEYAYSVIYYRCNGNVSNSRKDFFKNISDSNC